MKSRNAFNGKQAYCKELTQPEAAGTVWYRHRGRAQRLTPLQIRGDSINGAKWLDPEFTENFYELIKKKKEKQCYRIPSKRCEREQQRVLTNRQEKNSTFPVIRETGIQIATICHSTAI